MAQKKAKAIIHYCEGCGNERLDKKEGYVCKECGGVYLGIERLY